jgi:hypothetical protein
MNVALRNKITGQIKHQVIGWSWTCFLFSSCLGIPLFIRGLNIWGALMVAIWVVGLFSPLDVLVVLLLIQLVLSIWFGAAANSWAGRSYLENGWEFAEPDTPRSALARRKWGLPTIAAN